MTQAVATFDIKEFLPSEFRYDGFAFVFTSEGRDFEQEISYQNKNQITHRFFLLKKDLKYSIKVTKNNSLIGLCDLSIPQSITGKRETEFDKICHINMTDSVRRVLFGSPQANITLKINIHVSLQYKEKFGSKVNNSTSQKKDEKVNKELGNSNKKLKILDKEKNLPNYQQKNTNQKKSANLKKQNSSSKTKIVSSGVPKEKNISQKESNADMSENQNDNDSYIDDEINKPIQNVDSEFLDFMKNFEKNNPLDKINQFNNVSDMAEYTKNNIELLLDYQMKYYELLKNNLNTKNKLKDLLTQYNEKYRLAKKKLNKLNEDKDKIDFESNILYNPEFNDFNELISPNENELDIYHNIYNNYSENNVIQNENNVQNENNDQQIQTKQINDDNTQTLLVKVLSHIIKNYGPSNHILNQSNSEESERINLKNLINKYNLNNGEEENNNENENVENNGNEEENLKEDEDAQGGLDAKIQKWEYVSTGKPDKIDIKLENYLKYFYSKRTFPKIIFRKTSSNNYEYGTQKVMIKIEGDTIRVRYVGGYSLLDKFIEINAALEEGKENKKKNNLKNSGGVSSQNNLKKKPGKSTKTK